MKTILRALALIALCAVGWSQNNQKLEVKDFLGPNNTFQDRLVGLSLTYPAGWEVVSGYSYPQSASCTFWFRPLWPSEASPSIHYRRARPDAPGPSNIRAAQLENARKFEASRQVQTPDFRIDPKTLATRTIAGQPAISYVATHSSGTRKLAEYHLGIRGEKGSVWFNATGPVEDVLAIRREIDQMAETVQLP